MGFDRICHDVPRDILRDLLGTYPVEFPKAHIVGTPRSTVASHGSPVGSPKGTHGHSTARRGGTQKHVTWHPMI